eukprot:338172_1
MDTSTLDEKYDTFVERYSHKPSVDQFKNFAKIRYMDAKKYITSRKQDRKTSADLPIKSTPPLLPKSRTSRAYSTYNTIPSSSATSSTSSSPSKPIKTNPINTVINENNGTISMNINKYEECKEKEKEKESNNINIINISQSMPISFDNKHSNNNQELYAPSQHTRFLPLHNNNNINKNGCLTINDIDENYYN